MKQVTLGSVFSASGVGLHTGVVAEVVVRPAKAGAGVVLRRVDVAAGKGDFVLDGLAGVKLVKYGPLATVLENEFGVTLGTVEHLLSAFHGLRVDNVVVEVSGPEVPILDGSALPWVELIDQARRVETKLLREWVKVEGPVRHEEGRSLLLAESDPRAGLRVECHVEFPHPAVGRQSWLGVVDEVTYRAQIAPARTFVLQRDVAAAQAAGLVKGGGLHNAVVFGDDGSILNPEGLRFVDEPVRHKVLDVVGDLFVAGRCVWGKLTLNAPGHVANNKLLQKIIAG